ncbi:MAG TPA: ABC transporter ATP-binding protein, partial [Turneriella sp.]|nr:ABC transporter ATP-binding protein [Turneriella sp.]
KKISFFDFKKSTYTGVMHVEDAAAILPDFLKKVGKQNLESFAARPLTLDDIFIKMTGRQIDV